MFGKYVSVLRKTAGQNEGSAVGGRRIFADVQAAGQRQFSVAEEWSGGKIDDSRAVYLAVAGTFNRAAEGNKTSAKKRRHLAQKRG